MLARGVLAGVEDYPSFAPAGWTGPTLEDEIAELRTSLALEHVFCVAATAGGELIGQVTILPAARGPHPVDDPGLAHFSNLFVRREHWGAGLAGELHAAAIDAARERGFTQIRLYVAEGQARARRFYEREGWRPAGEPYHDPSPGLRMIEYRRRVGPCADG